MKPQAKRTLLFLLANTIILMVLYFWIPEQLHFPYMPHIYLAVGAILALYYVIYNRGFTGKNTTPDMLPDSMSPAEKQRFLEDSRTRLEKSKWVLTLLIPIVAVFFADMIYLFIFPVIKGWFQ